MVTLLKAAAKALGVYFVKNYLLSLAYDLLIEGAESLAKKTETDIDDKFVATLKADKDKLIAVVKGV